MCKASLRMEAHVFPGRCGADKHHSNCSNLIASTCSRGSGFHIAAAPLCVESLTRVNLRRSAAANRREMLSTSCPRLHAIVCLMLSYCVLAFVPTIQHQQIQWHHSLSSFDRDWHWRSSFSHRHLATTAPTTSSDTGPTISSSACNNLRTDPFPAELELFYFYRIDFIAGTAVDLAIVENVINQAVVLKLNQCDSQDRPLYALDLNPSHVLLQDGNCTSLLSHVDCLLVEAATYILLDNGTQYAEALAYEAIQTSLSDKSYLQSLQPSIESVEFVGSEDSRVVNLPTSDSQSVASPSQRPLTAKVAIAVASVSFVLAAIFSFGILRRVAAAQRRDPHLPQQRIDPTGPRVGIKNRGEYFEQLTDEEPDLSVTPKFPRGTSFILSPSELSDITFDDSASMLSTISRTTSKLERIDEEDEGPYDEEAAYGGEQRHHKHHKDDDDEDICKQHGLRWAEDCHVHVMEDYGPKRVPVFLGDEDKASDLVGCKYVDDGSLEGEPVAMLDVAPMEDWNASDDSIVPLESFPAAAAEEEETEVVLCLPSFEHVEMRLTELVSADDDETESTVNTDTSGEIAPLQKNQSEASELESNISHPACSDAFIHPIPTS